MSTLIDSRVRVNREAHAAIVAFRRSKPWRGEFAERMEKFKSLVAGLNAAYALETSLEFHGVEDRTRLGNGGYDPDKKKLIMVGKLSVVTLLHIYARARGMTRQEAFRWSLSVFAKMFPISFGRCRLVGCILVRDGEPQA